MLEEYMIKMEGYLFKISNGRYAIDGNESYQLTSGDCVEVNTDGSWEQTRVEFSHAEKDYILINGHPIDGAFVRIS
jgi:hypothetical protein